jgi:hypothetical protein
MANKFEVQVVALDRFTSVFRKVNNEASKTARPLANIGRQTGALFKEMHLPKALKGIRALSRAGQEISGSLGGAGGSMATVFGLGAAGGIVSTVAAVGQLASAWATLGANVLQTSRMIGMDAQELQKWQGAAKLAGVSAEDMTSSLGNLAKTQQDARYGRNPLAATLMKSFGISASNPDRAMSDLFRASAGMTPQTRIKLFESLGVSPSLIPLGHPSKGGIASLKAQAQAKGLVQSPQQLQEAEDARMKMLSAGASAAGLANKVGAATGGVISDAVEGMAKMINGERPKYVPRGNRANTPMQEYGPDHGASAQKPKVEITVKIPNAPEGTTVDATMDGTPVPIGRSMED